MIMVAQDVADMERSKGRPKAVDKYREETVWSQIVHSNWVSQVRYVPELESALSCSLDTYLWLMDVERRYGPKPPYPPRLARFPAVRALRAISAVAQRACRQCGLLFRLVSTGWCGLYLLPLLVEVLPLVSGRAWHGDQL